MLRKASQEILDEYNLSDYHTAIEYNNRYLQIVGPCGKPLLKISGVVFTSKAPTNKEIDFATSLLTEFLIQHNKTIQDLLVAKAKLSATPLPEHPKGIEVNGSTGKESVSFKSDDYPGYTFTFGMADKTISIYKIGGYDTIAITMLTALLKDKKIKSDIAAAVKAQSAYWDIEAKCDDLLSKVQTCNI